MEFAEQPSGFRKNSDFDLYYYVHEDKFDVDESRKHAIVIGNVRGQERKFTLQEFVWLCSHCKRIYTNSFHGVCFGTMFNKKLVIDKRRRNIRIEQLFHLLGIHLSDDGSILDYDTVEKNIIHERENGKKYLDQVFKMVESKQERYAVYSKQSVVRELSSSGGFCGTLAEKTLNNGGIVYGAAYIDGFKHVRTVRVDNISDYFKLVSKSKYSFCQDCDFNLVKNDLESGRKVLFTGCPCQVKKLKSFLGKDYENLTTLDLFCYGYSEPKVLEDFISEIEKEVGSEVESLDMRKSHKHLCSVTFKNGTCMEYNNVFSKFISKDNLMPMCMTCNMHKGNNASDITVGDFWDWKMEIHPPEFNPGNGTNIVVPNTDVGKKQFHEISDRLAKIDLNWFNSEIPPKMDRRSLDSNTISVIN